MTTDSQHRQQAPTLTMLTMLTIEIDIPAVANGPNRTLDWIVDAAAASRERSLEDVVQPLDLRESGSAEKAAFQASNFWVGSGLDADIDLA